MKIAMVCNRLCMIFFVWTIKFLNENQILNDISDQPVYAYSKEVQWRDPTIFGYGYSEIFILSNLY